MALELLAEALAVEVRINHQLVDRIAVAARVRAAAVDRTRHWAED